jgi:transposase InsO family protein
MTMAIHGSSPGAPSRPGSTGTASTASPACSPPSGPTRELLEAINSAKPHFHGPGINRAAIYRFCIEKGLLRKESIAPTTFYRFIREYGLLSDTEEDQKKRMAFAMQYANELWQADTMFGPHIDTPAGKRQAKLIAFLDDASRVLCHGEFFIMENTDSFVSAIRSAFYKRGVPMQLYVDNGSVYTSAEITLICARVGCILRHAPVRDGAAKGKIERFFRRVRDQFLNRALDLSSLAALNRQFSTWAEDEYNATVHDALDMRPIDRFGLDLSRIRFLPPSEDTDELFFAEEERTVKKDNTFSFKNIRYETPVDLRGKVVALRYQRSICDRIVIYCKGSRMGVARPLDLIANGQRHRKENP